MMIGFRTEDHLDLRNITPVALSHYARSEGWSKVGIYRKYSDLYAADGKPEIIVPSADIIDDYEMAVSDLIAVFSKVLDRDNISIYRDLTVADRDVLRIRALEVSSEGLPFETGHTMLDRTRNMLAASAYSLGNNRRVYRTRMSREIADYLRGINWRTESGSFALILISPAIAPRLRSSTLDVQNEVTPKERLVAHRLSESLIATRIATQSVISGDDYAFERATESGVSANLCEAVAGLVESVSSFDVSFSWARTRPSDAPRGPVMFSHGDVSILKEVALSFRKLEPEYDKLLSGFIYRLTRDQDQIYGTISVRASVDGVSRSVVAVLGERDYTRAIEAYKSNSIVSLRGDLERTSQQMHLRNARIVDVIQVPTLLGMEKSEF